MPSSIRITDIAAKVEAGLRLGFDEGVRLFSSRDLHEIGRLADAVRRRKNGRVAYYIINCHINYTNYCVFRCKFCGFRRAVGGASDGGYQLTVEQIVAQALEAYLAGANEVHIVGGLHPKLPFEYYVDMIRGIRQSCPKIHIKAFTAIEILHLGHMARPRLDIAGVLSRLREAGLDSLPGGGAEIFDDRVHDEAFRHKAGQEGWFAVHRIAHEMGIPSNATMLYGHIESPAERVAHLIKLRRHQDASMVGRRAHFQCLVPLPFVPTATEWSGLPGPTGLESLRTLGIARLILDNFAHIKAFWPMLSPKLAQIALNFGVDDLDGTVQYYDITHRDGAPPDKQALSVDALRRLIIETDHIPVQRDSLYKPVKSGG
jgi:aminodeoxyfutalosine synthase